MEIDSVVKQSLTDFVGDILRMQWFGKEREAISLYAFGYLLKYCRPGAVLHDARQIGIEVRVPKPEQLGTKAEVCKDRVIWPKPGMTCWTAKKEAKNYPLAILEWKMGRRNFSSYDAKWLLEFSAASRTFVGYAIRLDPSTKGFRLGVTRIQNESAENDWLVL